MVDANKQRPVAAPSISSASPSPVMGSRPGPPHPQEQVKEILAKKDVDEVLEYIEGNKNLSNDKKRLKKERQKQQRLEELRAKQEEERKRKAAEEAARKAREEEERLRKELEEKALKKSKKKAAQKAKKLANSGAAGDSPCPETPDNEPER
jgi:translation initiation factor 4G